MNCCVFLFLFCGWRAVKETVCPLYSMHKFFRGFTPHTTTAIIIKRKTHMAGVIANLSRKTPSTVPPHHPVPDRYHLVDKRCKCDNGPSAAPVMQQKPNSDTRVHIKNASYRMDKAVHGHRSGGRRVQSKAGKRHFDRHDH